MLLKPRKAERLLRNQHCRIGLGPASKAAFSFLRLPDLLTGVESEAGVAPGLLFGKV